MTFRINNHELKTPQDIKKLKKELQKPTNDFSESLLVVTQQEFGLIMAGIYGQGPWIDRLASDYALGHFTANAIFGDEEKIKAHGDILKMLKRCYAAERWPRQVIYAIEQLAAKRAQRAKLSELALGRIARAMPYWGVEGRQYAPPYVTKPKSPVVKGKNWLKQVPRATADKIRKIRLDARKAPNAERLALRKAKKAAEAAQKQDAET